MLPLISSNLPEDLLPLGLVLRVGEQAVVMQVFNATQAGLDVFGRCSGLGNNVSDNILLWPPECFRPPRPSLTRWIPLRGLVIFIT